MTRRNGTFRRQVRNGRVSNDGKMVRWCGTNSGLVFSGKSLHKGDQLQLTVKHAENTVVVVGFCQVDPNRVKRFPKYKSLTEIEITGYQKFDFEGIFSMENKECCFKMERSVCTEAYKTGKDVWMVVDLVCGDGVAQISYTGNRAVAAFCSKSGASIALNETRTEARRIPIDKCLETIARLPVNLKASEELDIRLLLSPELSSRGGIPPTFWVTVDAEKTANPRKTLTNWIKRDVACHRRHHSIQNDEIFIHVKPNGYMTLVNLEDGRIIMNIDRRKNGKLSFDLVFRLYRSVLTIVSYKINKALTSSTSSVTGSGILRFSPHGTSHHTITGARQMADPCFTPCTTGMQMDAPAHRTDVSNRQEREIGRGQSREMEDTCSNVRTNHVNAPSRQQQPELRQINSSGGQPASQQQTEPRQINSSGGQPASQQQTEPRQIGRQKRIRKKRSHERPTKQARIDGMLKKHAEAQKEHPGGSRERPVQQARVDELCREQTESQNENSGGWSEQICRQENAGLASCNLQSLSTSPLRPRNAVSSSHRALNITAKSVVIEKNTHVHNYYDRHVNVTVPNSENMNIKV